jgi:hypothetical protein
LKYRHEFHNRDAQFLQVRNLLHETIKGSGARGIDAGSGLTRESPNVKLVDDCVGFVAQCRSGRGQFVGERLACTNDPQWRFLAFEPSSIARVLSNASGKNTQRA